MLGGYKSIAAAISRRQNTVQRCGWLLQRWACIRGCASARFGFFQNFHPPYSTRPQQRRVHCANAGKIRINRCSYIQVSEHSSEMRVVVAAAGVVSYVHTLQIYLLATWVGLGSLLLLLMQYKLRRRATDDAISADASKQVILSLLRMSL
jgi:hypothetical protein